MTKGLKTSGHLKGKTMGLKCDQCGRTIKPWERRKGWPTIRKEGKLCPTCCGVPDRTRCEKCGRKLTSWERRKDWPVLTREGRLCPTCFGPKAYCQCGALLSGTDDSTECGNCQRRNWNKCTRCGHIATPWERRRGWPIFTLAQELVCPSCYGREAYCQCGALLPGNIDTSECGNCARRNRE
jgi:hypothetical protein